MFIDDHAEEPRQRTLQLSNLLEEFPEYTASAESYVVFSILFRHMRCGFGFGQLIIFIVQSFSLLKHLDVTVIS